MSSLNSTGVVRVTEEMDSLMGGPCRRGHEQDLSYRGTWTISSVTPLRLQLKIRNNTLFFSGNALSPRPPR